MEFDGNLPTHVVVNLGMQINWLFQNDSHLAQYVTDTMIGAAIDGCLWSITDGLDMLDSIYCSLETAVDAGLEDAANNGNLPPGDDDSYELANNIVAMLFGFATRCFAVFKNSGIPLFETVGAPYEYEGRNIRGLVLLKKKDPVCTSAMFEI